MKAILTLIAVISFGTLAMAQDISKEVKVETMAVGVELDITIE